MKKASYLGLSLMLIVVLSTSGFSQAAAQPRAKSQAEYDMYLGFFNEKDPVKKAAAGEKFLETFKESDFVPGTRLAIFTAYHTAKNCAKTMEWADKIAAAAGTTNEQKVGVFLGAMECAQAANNAPKVIEYGDKTLGVDANNLNAQLTLATTIPEALPNDKAALTKAEGLAAKAIAGVEALPAAQVPEAQKNMLLGQLHGAVGLIHLNRTEYEKSIEAYLQSIKYAPKEWVARYRLGLAYNGQLPNLSNMMVEAINAENAARQAKADQIVIDELAAKGQGLAEATRQMLDKAIEEMATAVALGGAQAAPARAQLERLYKQKNTNLDGMDELINRKKAELGSN
jgi:tetratricopeptide (TPR) repeat protein